MKLFFVCVSVKRFAFRQCQLAHCLLLKMRSAALLSLLSYTLHDFAMFVSCFFILSGFITVVFCIFQYSIWKWINCSHFFFCHHLPISQFLLLIHFLISWVFVIKYILREKLSVLYSLRSFFLKYVCFYLHDTMPGKIFFSPNFFTSELCFTFLHQFSGTGYCCGEECDANLSLFFSFVHDLVLCLWKYFKLNKWIRSFLGLRLPYLIILIRIWGVIITLLSLAVLRNSLLASL